MACGPVTDVITRFQTNKTNRQTDKPTNKTNTFLLLPQASISNFAAGLGSPQTRIVPGHSVELGRIDKPLQTQFDFVFN